MYYSQMYAMYSTKENVEIIFAYSGVGTVQPYPITMSTAAGQSTRKIRACNRSEILG